jgi:uncharacterized membrane protein YfcA
MDLFLDLPVAGAGVSLLALLGIGILVGGLGGFFGVGPGFLLTPLLITIGVPPTVAAASVANQVVATSAPGALGSLRARAVDLGMVLPLLAGAVSGGTAGVLLIRWLGVADRADLAVTLVYVVLLTGLGVHILRDSLQEHRGVKRVRESRAARRLRSPLLVRILDALPLRAIFARSRVTHSVLTPLLAGLVAGVLTGVTGIGGRFLLIPVAVYLLGMPIHLAAGSVLVLVCLSCLNVTVQHAALNGTVDVVLALVLVVGTVLGAQIGSRVGRRLRADQLRILLAVIFLFAAVKLATGVLLPPDVTILAAAPGGGP